MVTPIVGFVPGIATFGAVLGLAVITIILMFVLNKKVIEQKSDTEDLQSLFPEVEAKKDGPEFTDTFQQMANGELEQIQ